jgi:hypothetical protein
MNMSVAATGLCPSHPPRTTRATRSPSCGMSQRLSRVGQLPRYYRQQSRRATPPATTERTVTGCLRPKPGVRKPTSPPRCWAHESAPNGFVAGRPHDSACLKIGELDYIGRSMQPAHLNSRTRPGRPDGLQAVRHRVRPLNPASTRNPPHCRPARPAAAPPPTPAAPQPEVAAGRHRALCAPADAEVTVSRPAAAQVPDNTIAARSRRDAHITGHPPLTQARGPGTRRAALTWLG